MKVIEALNNWTMKEPQVYGLFHIFFLLVMISTTILLVHHFRDSSAKVMKRIVLISWIILVVFEVIKQFMFSYQDGRLVYNWGAFPYQFCETPLYVMPILILTKNEKLSKACISFLSTYAFFAGLAVMLWPSTVLSTFVFLSIRTMIQHGIQVAIGIFLFSWNRKSATYKSFAHATIIFLISVVIAILLNEVLGRAILKVDMNMFFLAKNMDSEILIVKDMKPYVPWIIFILAYVVGFIGIAFGFHFAETKIYELIVKKGLQAKEKELEFKN